MSWVTAPSTALRAKFGFVFHDCDFVHDGSPEALAGRFKLGRQWFEWVRATPFGVSPVPGYRCDLAETSFYDPPVGGISRKTLESVGKVAILNSRIGPHIDAADPWDSWNGASHPDGSPIWAPRYRPPLYRAGDMLGPLEGWLAAQGLDYGDIDPETPWLAEYGSDGPHM